MKINIKKQFILGLLFFALCSSTYAQMVIKGKVTDPNGEPLPGVNITEKGTSNGKVSDAEGNYSITVKGENSVLSYLFVGYKTYEQKVMNQKVINVVLKSELSELDEVVVVGFGRQKKGAITGAVSSMQKGELEKMPVGNITTMLSGRIAGVITRQTSGAPGADDASIKIRSAGAPLVIVDGVERSFSNLDPSEIENISVLKDAASTAVYGVRGGNGVLLITTKRGNTGKPVINYRSTYSITKNTRFPDFLNGVDYAYWYNKAQEMDGVAPENLAFQADAVAKIKKGYDENGIYGNTDWFDLLFKDHGTTQNHSLSVSGGTDKVKYYVMGGYLDQKGVIEGVDFERYNMRSNIDAKITKGLSLKLDLAGRVEKRDRPYLGVGPNDYLNLVYQAVKARPTIPAYDTNGNPVGSDLGWGNVNPVMARDNSGYYRSTMSVFNSRVTLKYDVPFVKGLSVQMMAAYDKDYTKSKSWATPYKLMVYKQASGVYEEQWSSHKGDGKNYLSQGFGDMYSFTLRPRIDYQTKFGKHSLKAMFLYERYKRVTENFGGGIKDLDLEDLQELSLANPDHDKNIYGSSGEIKKEGYIGRLNYDYDNKYLLEASCRVDGSVLFPEDERWGVFPAVSLGWRLSEESFIKDNYDFIDNIKLRASTGRTGSDSGVASFPYMRLVQLTGSPVVNIGGEAQLGMYTGAIPNYDLTWEKCMDYNGGVEFSLWKGLIGVEFDYFYKVRSDILIGNGGTYPPSIGGNYQAYVNEGIRDVKGFELVLKHKNSLGDFNYSVIANVTKARERYVEVNESANIPDNMRVTGQYVGVKYGFIAEGLFQSQEEIDNSPLLKPDVRPGDIKYRDLNGDGKITYEQDRTVIGESSTPDIIYSFNLSADYKGFDLSMLFQGATGTEIALSGTYSNGVQDNTSFTRTFYSGGNVPYYLVEDSWTTENRDAKYTRLSAGYQSNNAYASTWWIRDASYLRLKTLQLGYSLPKSLLDKFNVQKFRVFFTGSNLVTWDDLDYLDPESPSVHNGYYPQQKEYSFGLQLTF